MDTFCRINDIKVMTKAAATLPTPYSVSDGLFSPTRPNDDDETWSAAEQFKLHSNLDIVNKFVRPFLFTILNYSLYQM